MENGILILEIIFHHDIGFVCPSLRLVNKKMAELFSLFFFEWLRKFEKKEKFLFSTCSKPVFGKELKEIFGCSLKYFRKDLSYEELQNWWEYHEFFYKSWKGQLFDCHWTLQNYPLNGEFGVLAFEMATNNFPFPIDLFVRKMKESTDELDHCLYLIMEGYDTSVYDPVYRGDCRGISLLLETFGENNVWLVENQDIPEVEGLTKEELKIVKNLNFNRLINSYF